MGEWQTEDSKRSLQSPFATLCTLLCAGLDSVHYKVYCIQFQTGCDFRHLIYFSRPYDLPVALSCIDCERTVKEDRATNWRARVTLFRIVKQALCCKSRIVPNSGNGDSSMNQLPKEVEYQLVHHIHISCVTLINVFCLSCSTYSTHGKWQQFITVKMPGEALQNSWVFGEQDARHRHL